MDLEEEFLFCTRLTTTATSADIVYLVDYFQQEGINWKTVSVYVLTALPQCLVLDTGLLHESGKSILVSKLSMFSAPRKPCCATFVFGSFCLDEGGCWCSQLYQSQCCLLLSIRAVVC